MNKTNIRIDVKKSKIILFFDKKNSYILNSNK